MQYVCGGELVQVTDSADDHCSPERGLCLSLLMEYFLSDLRQYEVFA